MVVGIKDVVTLDTQDYFEQARETARRKAPYLKNTWKKGRTIEEKEEDLFPGEVAEMAVKELLVNLKIPFIHYDEIRTDDFKYHDPFDFVFYNDTKDKKVFLKLLSKYVLRNVNEYGIIMPPFDFRSNGMLTVEVKSSKDNKSFGLRNILQYQHHIGYVLSPLHRYADKGYTLSTIPNVSEKHIQRYIKKNTRVKDINIRAFFTRLDLSEVNIVGWVEKEILLTRGEIGTFSHNPNAVYHKLLLSEGKKIEEMPKIREKLASLV